MKMPVMIKSYWLLTGLLASGCGVMSDGPAKKTPANLIATPASYYSTAKARYLGSKYKDNLDRLTEKIVRNSGTTQLQFANNISSVGGIGFFTHSATKTADERYLEVVLATPETFESKGDYSEKVNQLFSRYGQDLLSILVGDSQIFQDKELAGYGLNLNWRTVIADGPQNRVSLARAVVYFHKERAAGFLRRSISQNELLSDAVIFAVEDDGPLQLVSYQPRENKPDSRPAIREDDLLAGSSVPAAGASPDDMAKRNVAKPIASKAEPSKKEEPVSATASRKETLPTPSSGGLLLSEPAPTPGEMKSASLAGEKSAVIEPVREPESVALSIPPVEAQSVKPVPEVVLQEAAPQRIAPPPAKKEQVTAQKAAPSSSKPEPMKLSTDTAKEPRNVSSAVKAPETKSDPIPSDDHAKVKASAPSVAMTKPPEIPQIAPQQESTKQSGIVEARPAVELSKPSERSVPTVPPVGVEPETSKLSVGPQAPKNPAMVAEASVKSPVGAMKPAVSAERLASQTAPTAKLPSSPLPTPAVEPAAKSPVAETKSSGVAARPEVPTDSPAKVSQPLPAVPIAKEVVKSPATEAKSTTSAKSPLVEAKPAISQARIEDSRPPMTKVPAGTAGASPFPEVARPVGESKAASSSTGAEVPAARSAQLPERPVVAPAAPVKSPPEAAKIDKSRRDAEQVVSNKPVEPTTTTPVHDPSRALKTAPTPGTASPLVARPEIKPKEQVSVESSSNRPAQDTNSLQARNDDSAPSLARSEVLEPTTRAAPAQSGHAKKASSPAPGEQLALLRKPAEPVVERAPVARPAPKPLQGFIIQVAFQDKQKAQSWAEKMTQRGYAVSVTEAGPEGSLRVRLGNFAVRDEAERQLQNFMQEGMSGIIINLPQAFRPQAVSSIP